MGLISAQTPPLIVVLWGLYPNLICPSKYVAIFKTKSTKVMEQGKAVLQHVCAPCHGAGPGLDGSKMLPGTAAIVAKYKGTVPPLLEQRPNLTLEFIKHIVRHGSGAMPMFRKTEITDSELEAVAAYLMRDNK